MPVGTVRWFDPNVDEARIVHLRHDGPVDAGELKPEARIPKEGVAST